MLQNLHLCTSFLHVCSIPLLKNFFLVFVFWVLGFFFKFVYYFFFFVLPSSWVQMNGRIRCSLHSAFFCVQMPLYSDTFLWPQSQPRVSSSGPLLSITNVPAVSWLSLEMRNNADKQRRHMTREHGGDRNEEQWSRWQKPRLGGSREDRRRKTEGRLSHSD